LQVSKHTLDLIKCAAQVQRTASRVIAAFALILDASTSAAIANDTFTQSHMRFARGEYSPKL
ncbi:hypothetical protein F5883DRAFT_439231, partial [Diaporthe sp. PMI_573]